MLTVALAAGLVILIGLLYFAAKMTRQGSRYNRSAASAIVPLYKSNSARGSGAGDN
jgi:hypothetical protein